MASLVRSLHHVTATVGDAQEDLDFCRGTLGLRLVKKTVNFDNHAVYHFYYGDERGAPGTLWTTFPYRGQGVAAGSTGAGQVVVTSFSVPAASLAFWRSRLAERGAPFEEVATRFGEASIVAHDPSGLSLALVACDGDRRQPWTGGGLPEEAAIRGLHGVTLLVRSLAETLELMTGLLGLEVAKRSEASARLAAGGDGPGKWIDVVEDPQAAPGRNGLGTVHHVALAVVGDEDQLRIRRELVRLGRSVTEVMDRHYFRSIYFREPGGVLLEVATSGPGFTVDEELPRLGRGMMLPPWEEPHRQAIESALPAIVAR